MTTAIDRAAKAISETTIVTADGQSCPQNTARAALASIREPTSEMIIAGAKKIPGNCQTECAARVWLAMYEAMMEEHKDV